LSPPDPHPDSDTDPGPGFIAHVFHPTDFSHGSALAFAHALRIALTSESGLTLFHVDRDGEDAHWSDFPAVRSTLERWGLLPHGSGRDAVARLGIDVEKVRAPGGDPVRAILDYLKQDPAELVVLASHGREGLERLRSPSVAEPVARGTRAATLFLPHGARGFVAPEDGRVTLQRILVPVDDSPRPQAAAAAACQVRSTLGASPEITFLHVGSPSEAPQIEVPPALRERVAHRTVDGPVVEAIVEQARDLPADLIVMTTRGHDGFLDALRGSTTERVLRHAGCALLAIPERS